MDTPNRFPKVLPAKKMELGHMKSMDLWTLYSSNCIHGSSQKWNDTIVDLYDCQCGLHIADLLHRLRTVERSIDPGTYAKVIFSICRMHRGTVFSQSGYCRIFGGAQGIFEGSLRQLHFEFHQGQLSQDNKDRNFVSQRVWTQSWLIRTGRKAGRQTSWVGRVVRVGWWAGAGGGQGLVAGPIGWTPWRARSGGGPGGWRGMDLQNKEFSRVNIKT